MPTSKRSREELADLGNAIFDQQVRPGVRPEDDGKFVAIDVETGDFELNEDDYTAVARLRSRKPTADIWLMRVGHRAAYSIGAGR